jgi:outer membrane protein TolC
MRRMHLLFFGLSALLLAGCATTSADGGFGAVSDLVEQRSGQRADMLRNEQQEQSLSATLDGILKQPLTAGDAVRIALLNNRGLQAQYWDVGIAEADLAQAGRLQNPSFAFKRTHAGADIEIERTLTFNLMNLATAPLARNIEGRRFEQAKLVVAHAMLQHAAETRRAYYEAVAGVEGVAYARQVSAASEASAELAARMTKAGNWSKLDLAREQAFHAEAMAMVTQAARQALAARERLTRLMGLSGTQAAFLLPERLPELPAAAIKLENAEDIALRDRLDIQAAKLDAAATASALGLNKATRFINVLDLGAVRNSGGRGYEITLELPLFDWGSARVARSEAIYMQAVNKVAEAATNARSQARASYQDYQSAYALAVHYRDEVIPLRKKISDETLLRYNGMLISPFELLADAREQAVAVNAYLGAIKDYWIAHAELEAALGSRLPSATNKDTTP